MEKLLISFTFFLKRMSLAIIPPNLDDNKNEFAVVYVSNAVSKFVEYAKGSDRCDQVAPLTFVDSIIIDLKTAQEFLDGNTRAPLADKMKETMVLLMRHRTELNEENLTDEALLVQIYDRMDELIAITDNEFQ